MKKPTLNHSILRQHDFEPLDFEGKFPPELSGTIYRVGPGLLERFGRPVAHPFDTDGAITAVRLAGQAAGASQVIKSDKYFEEEKAGCFLYGTSASSLRQFASHMQGKAKSTGNTNLLYWQRKLYALVENAQPVEINPNTLVTGAVSNLGGTIRQAFSAHPHRVESLKTTFNFGMRGNMVDLYALPDQDPSKWLGAITVPWQGMIHDFIATEKHLVFFIGPAKLVIWRALFGIGGLSKFFKWDPAAGMRIIVVPLGNPEKPLHISVDAFWVWHFVNAYESGSDIVVDAIRHNDFAAFASPSSPAPALATPSLHRFRIDTKTGKFSGEPLWTTPCEFPSVHPKLAGGQHRYVWLQTFSDADGQGGGVACYDTRTAKLRKWAAPRGHMGSEPMFVPAAGAEDAGWILQLIKDPSVERSYLAIIDSTKLEDGPIAKAWFKQAVPMTFHGTFVAEQAM